ncbi:MAG: hypothetical protein K6G22_09360 [Lachnospiraceae bacterium]|nr:hypothetical protein [Lachnospiraceae bacterium]
MMLIILPFASPIAALLGASGNTSALLPKASAYLIGISLGLPAMNIIRVLNSFLPIDNDRNLPLIGSAVLTATDVVLDLVVAFVIHGDTFEMGLATSISYYACLFILLLHFRKKEAILKYSPKNLPWKETAGMVSQGIPIGVCNLGFTVRAAYMNRLLSTVSSSAAVAASSISIISRASERAGSHPYPDFYPNAHF